MTYRKLLSLSASWFVFLSFSTVFIAYSQRERPRENVGTPICEIIYEESHARTADIRCSYTGVARDGCNPSDPINQRRLVYERKPARAACRFTQRMSCLTNTSAGWGYVCDDTGETGGETASITCLFRASSTAQPQIVRDLVAALFGIRHIVNGTRRVVMLHLLNLTNPKAAAM